MKLTLQFIITTFIVLVIYMPVAHGQANLTFSGGSGSPLTITLQQSVSYTITNTQCSFTGPYFVFDEAGNPFLGTSQPISGTITFPIDGGIERPINTANSGATGNDISANDIFVYGPRVLMSPGSTIVLSAGTVTTRSTHITGGSPANGSFSTFITNNIGNRCSSNGVSSGMTAASVSISGKVLTNSGRGLASAFVYLTDSEGNTRTARTNSFGYYRFQDIQAGLTVTVTVVSKRFQFAPKVLNLNEQLTQLNFVAEN